MSSLDLRDEILYFDVGKGSDTFFNWTQKGRTPTAFRLEVMPARSFAWNSEVHFFVHWKKTDAKLSAYQEGGLVFVVVGKPSLQFQVMDAFLEHLAEKFIDAYGLTVDSYVVGSENLFSGFSTVVEDAFEVVTKDKVKLVRAVCKACGNKQIHVWVKKSLVEKSNVHPVALVYEHAAHAVLLYVDADFKVRAASVVEISG
ncbi:MAG: hypothetical protein Kow0069_00290 [Promethearchaeota archaeon]